LADDARSVALRRAAGMLAQEEELRRKKRALASLVVHDLRSPMSGALSYLDLIREELRTADPARLEALIGDARELMARALSLVSTILDVDELEDGMLRATPALMKLGKVLETAWRASLAGAQVRDLRWELAVPADLEVDLDADLFARVLENLFDNATRYAPRGGRVAAGATLANGVLEVTVGNDGPAVPPAEREQIFGRYHQVEARRASARANRGLGLYFCRLAIEAHGGSITVEERGEMRTTFVVRVPQPPMLPMRSEESSRIPRSDPAIALPRTTTADLPPPVARPKRPNDP
jgi:two-component system, OmpR family, heavy metal sensor histidine kinase CusS